MLIEDDITWHLWNKIFKGDLCRKAIQETEDIRLYTGSDAYLFLVIAGLSEIFLSKKTDPLYSYRVEQGLTTRHTITLDDFRNYVADTSIVGLPEAFLAKKLKVSSFDILLTHSRVLKFRRLDHFFRERLNNQ